MMVCRCSSMIPCWRHHNLELNGTPEGHGFLLQLPAASKIDSPSKHGSVYLLPQAGLVQLCRTCIP